MPLDAFGANLLILSMERVELLVAETFDVHHLVAGGVSGMNQLVELEIDCSCVPVLCVLNQEHHQECHDGGARIDNKLPRV